MPLTPTLVARFRPVPLWEKVVLGEIILIATIGGIASTYSAVSDILDPTSFESSCFISV